MDYHTDITDPVTGKERPVLTYDENIQPYDHVRIPPRTYQPENEFVPPTPKIPALRKAGSCFNTMFAGVVALLIILRILGIL